jgi:hypothetical protein
VAETSWTVITTAKLLDLLRRAHGKDGEEPEDPDLLLLELWGSAFHVDNSEGEDE